MMAAMKKFFLLTLLLSSLVALGAALLFIRTVIAPLAHIRDTASRIALGDLASRVQYDSTDELGELGRTINFMAEELRKLETARSEFLSNVSHELKTPLTIIKGFVVTLMSDPGASREMRRSLEIIERETDRLTRMVEELLELVRLPYRTVALRKTSFQLGEMFRSISAQLKPRAEEYGIDLVVNCPETLPQILADEDRIRGVILNLADNAMKYTPAGGRVALEGRVENDRAIISVSDTGAGIPPEDIPFLFERFFRSKKPVRGEGTGLGLAIVREIVHSHGGEIDVRSEIGQGTTFTVTLPLK